MRNQSQSKKSLLSFFLMIWPSKINNSVFAHTRHKKLKTPKNSFWKHFYQWCTTCGTFSMLCCDEEKNSCSIKNLNRLDVILLFHNKEPANYNIRLPYTYLENSLSLLRPWIKELSKSLYNKYKSTYLQWMGHSFSFLPNILLQKGGQKNPIIA